MDDDDDDCGGDKGTSPTVGPAILVSIQIIANIQNSSIEIIFNGAQCSSFPA